MEETTEHGGEINFSYFIANHIVLIILISLSFVVWLVFNSYYPYFFDPFQLWLFTEDVFGALTECWPLFTYCTGVTLVLTMVNYEKVYDKEAAFFQDIYKSVMAGILEEVAFRCMFIFIAMLAIVALDYLTFGLIMWFYQQISFPLTDIFTLGMMHDYIYGLPALVVAGALSANSMFKDGHRYLGLFGTINAWFVGIYLLYVMFTYGLFVAILAHMIYDLIIAFMRYGKNTLVAPIRRY